MTEKNSPDVVPSKCLFPFAFVTSLFAMWGVANDNANPLVKKTLQQIFLVNNAQSSLVQTTFYGGYATMVIPATLVIRKLLFKLDILIACHFLCIGNAAFHTTTISPICTFRNRTTPTSKQVYLVASGDLCPSANRAYCTAQQAMEHQLGEAVANFPWDSITKRT